MRRFHPVRLDAKPVGIFGWTCVMRLLLLLQLPTW
jgi:hypothetical protein